MFYAGIDLLFSILFPILFLVVLGMILYTIKTVKSVLQCTTLRVGLVKSLNMRRKTVWKLSGSKARKKRLNHIILILRALFHDTLFQHLLHGEILQS